MAEPRLRRRWTVVDDEVLHSRETLDASVPGARPILLLHGVGTTSRYFRPLLRELRGRAPAVAVELPGIGSSTSRAIPDDIAAQADLVARWLTCRRLVPAAVVGNSMGTQTATELAIRHPRLVDRLVLLGPTVDRAARGLVPQLGRLLVDATVERRTMLAIAGTDSFLTRRRAVVAYAGASLRHRMEERLREVDVPVTIVRGELDPLAPRRWTRDLAAVAPHARRVEIPGAAHACHHGAPVAVADLLVGIVGEAPR